MLDGGTLRPSTTTSIVSSSKPRQGGPWTPAQQRAFYADRKRKGLCDCGAKAWKPRGKPRRTRCLECTNVRAVKEKHWRDQRRMTGSAPKPRWRALKLGGKDDVWVLWAAMQAMVNDIHAPQDTMTPQQWERAQALLAQLDKSVNEMGAK